MVYFRSRCSLFLSGLVDYIVICFWIVDFNIGMKLDLVVISCRLLL
jgi:hypothetical protein